MGTTTSTDIFVQREDGPMNRRSMPLPILLVEDNEIDIEITQRIFARCGASVRLRVARDGDEALEVLLTGRSTNAPSTDELPRLVMLDLRLPRVEGREVLKRIKEDPDISAIPVAILSGASGERPLLECMALGANMYYVKPISASDAGKLVLAVEKYWGIIAGLRDAKASHEGEPERT